MKKFGAKLAKFRGTIAILDILHQKLATVCQNSVGKLHLPPCELF